MTKKRNQHSEKAPAARAQERRRERKYEIKNREINSFIF